MAAIVSLCKRRGFVSPGSELYGGFSNTYDYGHLGVQLKKNISDAWWRDFVARDAHTLGLETPVVMSPLVWKASGHVGEFTDPLAECEKCKMRFRIDHHVEGANDGMSLEELHDAFVAQHGESSNCLSDKNCDGTLSKPRHFNLLMQTNVGIVEDQSRVAYLRPETAQGAYIAYNEVARAARKRLPFGIAQHGRSFRNEVTPGNFIFRTREFEQMELQWFCDPSKAGDAYAWWIDRCEGWLRDVCGLRAESVRRREHSDAELAHYASATTDLEFEYPFGWGELWGIANRGDHDLRAHAAGSGADMKYVAPGGSKRDAAYPCVVEPAVGLNRLLLAVLCDAYEVETLNNGKQRTVMRFAPHLAPFQAAIMCVSTKEPKLAEIAEKAHAAVSSWAIADLDLGSGSVGKKYRRQDEIGTPFCITVDYDSLEDGQVTVRDRDTMQQVRMPIDALASSLL